MRALYAATLASSLAALAIAMGCGEEAAAPVVRPEPAPAPPAEAPDEPAPAPEVRVEPEDDAPEAETTDETDAPAADPAPSVARVEASDDGFTAQPLPEKMQNRLRSRLRETQRARILLREAVRLHHADGRDLVLALYELSLLERCANDRVARGESAREAFRTCRGDLLEAPRQNGIEAEECTEVRALRAELAPPGAGTPADWGGAITIAADEIVEGGCVLDRVRRFTLADPDRDGRPELELDLWSHTPDRTFRGMQPYTQRVRRWMVLDAATLRSQVALTLASLGGDYEQMEIDELAREVSFSDENADGRPDVIERRLEYSVHLSDADCDFDPDTGWPRGAAERGDDSADATCLRDGEDRLVWTYDAATDAWAEPAR